MNYHKIHSWTVTQQDAIEIQKKLTKHIICSGKPNTVHVIAGVDVAFPTCIQQKASISEKMGRAAIVVLTYPELKVIEQQTYAAPVLMPYIPGLLSFRELPLILGAFDKVINRPDLVMVDGMGIAHPRGLGIASHLGLFLQIPTIGCGKSLLTGTYNQTELTSTAGSWTPLKHKNHIIGAVMRTKRNTNPLFISPGHLISWQASIYYVLSCIRGYRLPEPTRLADKLSKTI